MFKYNNSKIVKVKVKVRRRKKRNVTGNNSILNSVDKVANLSTRVVGIIRWSLIRRILKILVLIFNQIIRLKVVGVKKKSRRKN